MKNLPRFHFVILFWLIVTVMTGVGCLKESPKQINPEEKLQLAMRTAEMTSKIYSETEVFIKIASDSSLVNKTITQCARLMINSYEKRALTEECLEEKRPKQDADIDTLHQFKYDSTYLTLIHLKLMELHEQFVANGDFTYFELFAYSEKLRTLLNLMNNICPTGDSTLTK
jgi:hypothetical protein